MKAQPELLGDTGWKNNLPAVASAWDDGQRVGVPDGGLHSDVLSPVHAYVLWGFATRQSSELDVSS